MSAAISILSSLNPYFTIFCNHVKTYKVSNIQCAKLGGDSLNVMRWSYGVQYDSNQDKITITINVIITDALSAGTTVLCALKDSNNNTLNTFSFRVEQDLPYGINLTYKRMFIRPFPELLGGGAKLAQVLRGEISISDIKLVAKDTNDNVITSIGWSNAGLCRSDDKGNIGIGSYDKPFVVETFRLPALVYLRVEYGDGTSYEVPVATITGPNPPAIEFSPPKIPVVAGYALFVNNHRINISS